MVSTGQSHHPKAWRAAMVSWGNRWRMGRAGTPPRWCRGHVLGHQGPGTDDGPVPDGDAGQDDGLIAHPHIVAQDDVPLLSQASVTWPRPAPTR